MQSSPQYASEVQSHASRGGDLPPVGALAVHASEARGPAVKRAPKPAAANRRLLPVIWLIVGFVGGIGFWHLIGFWSFVSTIVYKEERPTVHESIGMEDGRKLPTTIIGGIPPADANASSGCTTLRLDRVANRTTKAACDPILAVVAPPIAPRIADAPKAAEPPKSAEAPKPPEAPKAAEVPVPMVKKPSVAGWSVIIKEGGKKN